jgi:3-methyladenine DNA glycosylase Tag
MKNNKQTCSWPKGDPLLTKYHDTEWGVPLHNDRKLFEFLILEGFQAGLSWLTILINSISTKFQIMDSEKLIPCFRTVELSEIN